MLTISDLRSWRAIKGYEVFQFIQMSTFLRLRVSLAK